MNHSQVLNQINLETVTLSYQANPRWSFQLNTPFLVSTRVSESNPGHVFDSHGIGDISLTAQSWLWRPPTESRGNIALGFGLKIPSGNDAVKNSFVTATGTTTSTVDQSIQPGDGGWGIIANFQAFRAVRKAVFFMDGNYVMEPGDTNGVMTGRKAPLEAIMSEPDSYLADAGVAYPFPKIRGLAVNFGGRAEGIPARDLIGKSDGFRRPGFAISVVPGFEYSRNKNVWTFNLPIAVYRDRSRSVPDLEDDGHGDAFFASYLWLLTFSRRF
ncbi:MAG TPA: hypothetical protein VKV95_13905 [Terriglobia bacterium]|nr:hypothetical protein [Terriglobia bacterium]